MNRAVQKEALLCRFVGAAIIGVSGLFGDLLWCQGVLIGLAAWNIGDIIVDILRSGATR